MSDYSDQDRITIWPIDPWAREIVERATGVKWEPGASWRDAALGAVIPGHWERKAYVRQGDEYGSLLHDDRVIGGGYVMVVPGPKIRPLDGFKVTTAFDEMRAALERAGLSIDPSDDEYYEDGGPYSPGDDDRD